MTVRYFLALVCALAALCGTGCGGGDRGPLGAETDDPNYRLGKKLQLQGHDAEALSAFLKTIEVRGERNSPESHLEAGNIYLDHVKDPIEAYHHLRKFLELEPNAREARLVRGRIDTAKLEFSRSLAARPTDAAPSNAQSDEFEAMRRENAELKAEIATLRGGGAQYPARSVRVITLPTGAAAQQGTAAATAPANTIATPPSVPANPGPGTQTPLPAANPARASSPIQPVQMPTASRATNPPPANTTARTTAGGRSHTVTEKESLWSIARRYYGSSPTGAQVRGIYEANRGVMRNEGDLKPGMVLRIP